MGVAEQLVEIEDVLVRIAVTGQWAGDAARHLEKTGGEHHLIDALRTADRELLVIHRRLYAGVYIGRPPSAEQLSLGGGQLAHGRDEKVSEASAPTPRLERVNEQHMAEVERVLFEMSGARKRAEKVARTLAKDGAEPHLVEALERAERELEATIDSFFKSTYFHVPKDQLALS